LQQLERQLAERGHPGCRVLFLAPTIMVPSEYAYFALVAFDPREWLGLVLPSESKEAERTEPPVRSAPGQKQKKQPKLKPAGVKPTDSKTPTTLMLELPSGSDGASKIVVRCDELFKV
jgi:hypothetical protein